MSSSGMSCAVSCSVCSQRCLPGLPIQRCHRCTHDTRFILHLRRHNLSLDSQERQEFVGLLLTPPR